MRLIAMIFLLLTIVNGQEKYTTIKTSCIQQSEYSGKTLDQLKEILLYQAKQEALEELYGQLMYSKTDLKDGKIVSDEIRQRAIGSVRVEGNPKFYNGKNFGSICADVKSYITKKDLEKYSPKKVYLNGYCFNDSNIPISKIKEEAKYGAYKEIISQYKPSLKLSKEQAESFIHGFKISNDKFNFDTASYCFNAVATILPYELEISAVNKKVSKTNNIIKSSKKIKKLVIDHTIYGKWYGSYYWKNAEDFVMMNIEIKNDNTFKATLDRGNKIKNIYYTGIVMKHKNKVILLPDQKNPSGGGSDWENDRLQLVFDKNDLTLRGKIMNYDKKSGAKFVKVNKFPLEYAIENSNNNINGKWYGWYQCDNGYYYLTMDILDGQAKVNISNGKHILKVDSYNYIVYKTKREVLFDGEEKANRGYIELGQHKNSWTNDNFNAVINGNTMEGTSSCGSKYLFFATKVSKLPSEKF